MNNFANKQYHSAGSITQRAPARQRQHKTTQTERVQRICDL